MHVSSSVCLPLTAELSGIITFLYFSTFSVWKCLSIWRTQRLSFFFLCVYAFALNRATQNCAKSQEMPTAFLLHSLKVLVWSHNSSECLLVPGTWFKAGWFFRLWNGACKEELCSLGNIPILSARFSFFLKVLQLLAPPATVSVLS